MASSRLEDNKAAQRYARALFEKACAEGDADAIFQELKDVQAVFDTVPTLLPFFANPGIAQAEKFEFVQTQFDGKVSNWISNLLRLLIEHDRIGALDLLVVRYEDMVLERDRVARAEVVTALELEAALEKKIKATLQKCYGYQEIILEKRVDASILGGIIIKIQDRIIDGSYRGRLEALQKLA